MIKKEATKDGKQKRSERVYKRVEEAQCDFLGKRSDDEKIKIPP